MRRDRSPWRRARQVLATATPALALGTAALTAALAACSDSPTGPVTGRVTAARVPAPPPPAAMLAALANPQLTRSNVDNTARGPAFSRTPTAAHATGDTAVLTMMFDPRVDHTAQFATRNAKGDVSQHGVALVAHSVCDPVRSGYGAALWDAPCQVATQPFPLTIKSWPGTDGRPIVDFSPDLRFSPGTTNWLWLDVAKTAAHKDRVIAWCPVGGPACIDESRSDESLVTGTSHDVVYRRIKHFSGYTVIVN